MIAVLIFATSYPGGAGAFFAGIAWALTLGLASIAAIVAAALCFFRRTARVARFLSQVGVWSGCAALVAVLIVAAFIASDPNLEVGTSAYKAQLMDSWMLAAFCVPTLLISIFAWGFARRNMRLELKQ